MICVFITKKLMTRAITRYQIDFKAYYQYYHVSR